MPGRTLAGEYQALKQRWTKRIDLLDKETEIEMKGDQSWCRKSTAFKATYNKKKEKISQYFCLKPGQFKFNDALKWEIEKKTKLEELKGVAKYWAWIPTWQPVIGPFKWVSVTPGRAERAAKKSEVGTNCMDDIEVCKKVWQCKSVELNAKGKCIFHNDFTQFKIDDTSTQGYWRKEWSDVWPEKEEWPGQPE